MKMLFFGNNKSQSSPKPDPVPAAKISHPADADDFFKDMGRKPKKREVNVNIESPEIVGLREEPLPPPGSTIKNIASVSTDELIDKTNYDDGFIHGNIRVVNTASLDVDEALSRDKEKKSADLSEKVINSQNPDDFFKDIDRRRNRVRADIAVPEVTGLREAPLPPPDSSIRNIADVNTDGLIDKTGVITEGLGNIWEIDTGSIDADILGVK